MSGDPSLDMATARELFESSTDFTIGLEEEFALVDPETLDLVHRYEDLYARCMDDPELVDAAKGELIDTEIEIRSGKGETFAAAVELQRRKRARLFALAGELGIALAATGTHPWASYLDQRIIDTPHYNRLREQLRWVAQRNNTWSLHVHVGIRGADRAIAVCDRMRELLPALLAVSANSPFLDNQDTGLASVRTEIFTRVFPRCGVPEPFGDWAGYAEFVGLLERVGSIQESTELWWSVRPHHAFGTVEVRICDAQSSGEESIALEGLIAACVAQTALDLDEGRAREPLRGRQIEENFWRAIRHGMDAKLIDWERVEQVEARAVLDRTLEWTAPARAALGIEIELPQRNGAQRARDRLAAGASIADAYRASVEETARTYVPAGAVSPKD